MKSRIIRKAESFDCKEIWIWRNDPLTIKMFKNQKKVTWPEHRMWYTRAIRNKKCLFLIGQEDENKIGTVRFDIKDKYSDISINLNPKFRGKGLSKWLLKESCSIFFKNFDKEIIAEVKKINISSISSFKGVGFCLKMESDDFLTFSLKNSL